MAEHPDNFRLPGGEKSYGEIKAEYGEEFADKAFKAMERIQAEKGDLGELMDLYFDWVAQEEGIDHIVLGAEKPKVHHAHPKHAKQLSIRPFAKGSDT